MKPDPNFKDDAADIAPYRCPRCRYRMDAASTLTGANCQPKAGDFSICMRCGLIMRFKDATHLRAAAPAEIYDLPAKERAMALKASMVIPYGYAKLTAQRRRS